MVATVERDALSLSVSSFLRHSLPPSAKHNEAPLEYRMSRQDCKRA